jgi:hypothetical protein
VQLTPGQSAPGSATLERTPSLLEQRRRSALSKLKGLVIPENNESNSTPESPDKVVLSTPPWKSSNSTVPKYSPAFKRKPFTVYSNSAKPGASEPAAKPKPAERKLYDSGHQDEPKNVPKRLSVSGAPSTTTTPANMKSDNDSDNDSAVSSGRSSLSHGSASPPPASAPQPAERKMSLQSIKKSEDEDAKAEGLRVLKKDSVEAINRRNIIESCRTSSGTTTSAVVAPAFVKPVKKFPVAEDPKSPNHEEKIFRGCPPPPGRPASR